MPNPIKIQEYGSQLAVLFDDGSKLLAYPTSGGLWVVRPPGAPDAPGGTGTVTIPDSLTATMRDGTSVTLNKQQLTWAAKIITVGEGISGVGGDGIIIALMAALTESGLRMYSNSTHVPDSVNYPHDADGSDSDSLGLFQMRPSAGWGSVAQLMDGTYNAQAFYGGTSGPNHGSPAGLLDISGWQSMDKGAAAQAVEVSAFPDRYQNYQPVAEAIYAAEKGAPAGAYAVIFPTAVHSVSDSFSDHVARGSVNPGTDYTDAVGDTVVSVAAGVVTDANNNDISGSGGRLMHVDHDDGTGADYLHLSHISVSVGDHVAQGQPIALSGASGYGSESYYGAHLHISYRRNHNHGYGGTGNIDFDAYVRSLGLT